MTDSELKKLGDQPTPAPRQSAKRAAISAALEAFDDDARFSKTVDNENVAGEENFSTAPKETNFSERHTRTKHGRTWRRLMRVSKNDNAAPEGKQKRSFAVPYALAASFAALMIAIPAGIHVMQQPSLQEQPVLNSGGLMGMFSTGSETERRTNNNVKLDQLLAQKPAVRLSRLPNSEARDEPNKGLVRARPQRKHSAVQRQYAGPPMGVGRTGGNPANLSFGAGGAVTSQPAPNEYSMPQQDNRDKFVAKEENPIKQVATDPVSTFSIDVDTASYAFVRRNLMAGRLPPKAAVRVEELINYFPYNYPVPNDKERPFQTTVNVVPAPWNAEKKLVHIAIKGHDVKAIERPRANLVFLIDVSGSMKSNDKLPLLKNAFRMLLETLQPDDTVAIVTYASGSGVTLPPTKVSQKATILNVINKLGAGGSTAGAAGIQDAYSLAEANFDKEGVNRIILATDGDFNVGVSDREQLRSLIERKRKAGVFLSVLGFGRGNYNDALMQALAQNGNGTAAYIDTLNEARKVLVDEATSTLFTIAKDVKVQIEFNPKTVSEYRLIGYETRSLKTQDFNNDKIDAGDIGSGHTVTAIYEITPVGAKKAIDDLRYQANAPAAPDPDAATIVNASEYGFLKLRYKLPKEAASKLITQPIGPALERGSINAASDDVRFSTAVAAFGQLLRNSPWLNDYQYDDVLRLAQSGHGQDSFGYRAEFFNLVRLAKTAQP